MNTIDLKTLPGNKPRILLLFLLVLTPGLTERVSNAQAGYNPHELPYFYFIRYNDCRLDLTESIPQYQNLYLKFDSMLIAGSGNIRIIHIGGSHIQADMYTHRIRQHLQGLYPGITGARGFVFPYTIAGTNNPSNYSVSYTGRWEPRMNTRSGPDMQLGLSGITVALQDSAAELVITSRYDSVQHYDFNSVKVFCNQLNEDRVKVLPDEIVDTVMVNNVLGYIQFDLKEYQDTLRMHVLAPDLPEKSFELYGVSLENGDPGIIYDAIGVNGATLASFLRCDLFVPHMRALEPDWVIVSIGTNDAYTPRFDAREFRLRYIRLINRIKLAAPDAAILLTVPNDSYLYRRKPNENTATMQEVLFELARTYGCGVWDFYHIMGGYNSSARWFDSGLMNADHIHFNKPGYILKGDLFFNSFLNSWSTFNEMSHWQYSKQ